MESKTQDSRTGIDERQGERKAEMSSISFPDYGTSRSNSGYRHTTFESKGKSSRTSEGISYSEGKTFGQGDTSRSGSSRTASVS